VAPAGKQDERAPGPLGAGLRNEPQQARSRERVRRVLDVADEFLAREGAAALTTTRVAEAAGISVGSLYRYFPDRETIAEALAIRYWNELEDLLVAVAEADEAQPFDDPTVAILDALAAGFRARPGFLALWFGGLRTERVRDATRQTRVLAARSVDRVLAVHWPQAEPALRATVARMVVLAGDGLLREAFRLNPEGDGALLAESGRMLNAYIAARLDESRA
jgi:AcrR family transcriptional regulator